VTTYARFSQDTQDLVDGLPFGDVENLSLDDEVANGYEARQFQRRLDADELRRRICTDYDLRCCDAVTTIRRLEDSGLIGTPDEFLAIYCAGVEALAREAFTSPNDPPPDPMPDWRMLEGLQALAEARQGRDR
jgi:hypothetical protein